MQRMQKINHILFDLDGTLVDSSGAIQAALVHALQRLGLQYPTDCAIESLIGTPLLDIFRDRFGLVGEPAEQAIAHYREHYDEQAHAGTRVYDHVAETLDTLCASGIGLFVATVKPSPIAGKVLQDMGLQRYFRGISGSSMDHTRRDKGDIIRHALQEYGLEAGHSVMVGDRAQDISGARHNGLYAVGVTYGFGSLEELTAAAPDQLVSCSSEIPALLVDQHQLHA
jgi:phosphoglycolate phosphatase